MLGDLRSNEHAWANPHYTNHVFWIEWMKPIKGFFFFFVFFFATPPLTPNGQSYLPLLLNVPFLSLLKLLEFLLQHLLLVGVSKFVLKDGVTWLFFKIFQVCILKRKKKTWKVTIKKSDSKEKITKKEPRITKKKEKLNKKRIKRLPSSNNGVSNNDNSYTHLTCQLFCFFLNTHTHTQTQKRKKKWKAKKKKKLFFLVMAMELLCKLLLEMELLHIATMKKNKKKKEKKLMCIATMRKKKKKKEKEEEKKGNWL